jgi:hypothetical protein
MLQSIYWLSRHIKVTKEVKNHVILFFQERRFVVFMGFCYVVISIFLCLSLAPWYLTFVDSTYVGGKLRKNGKVKNSTFSAFNTHTVFLNLCFFHHVIVSTWPLNRLILIVINVESSHNYSCWIMCPMKDYWNMLTSYLPGSSHKSYANYLELVFAEYYYFKIHTFTFRTKKQVCRCYGYHYFTCNPPPTPVSLSPFIPLCIFLDLGNAYWFVASIDVSQMSKSIPETSISLSFLTSFFFDVRTLIL